MLFVMPLVRDSIFRWRMNIKDWDLSPRGKNQSSGNHITEGDQLQGLGYLE